ncbi:nickel-dependent lactate racemase [Desulfosporosinus nitroreducens]|uniref:nickel-dependent lactate racemase n=1 Tax=Desulfosporosinus nitroreducens TaxID=2018668 RepID=UPI00207D0F30|nr:nickel-dependent lactate racemase [Desulfosporosinus nitroreducens]MCO1600166.1 nickel-dependent lactate racemase [Desulfosporosinus nitroreducens]
MEVFLAYGKNGLNINVPEHTRVVEPTHLKLPENDHELVLDALSNPKGTNPLREMVKSTDRVVIVISDITRPTPNYKLIPWILEELPHVPVENITIINGLGTHRDQTREEFIEMLGETVVDTVRLVNHHCHEKSELSHLGTSSFGCEVYLNKEYVEADFRIVTGFIEPHFFAGFSGGPKGIMPGIAGIETILTFHNAKMIGHPLATWGKLDKNPLQEMTREVNNFCKPDFLLNVALNGEKEITNVFAGELVEAHAIGCAYVKEQAMVKCEKRYDVVITTNAGYPLDQNLYQAVKGMDAARMIVKQGGTIICAAECSEGMPEHGNFVKILQMRNSPKELLEMINEPSFQMFDQWEAQRLAMIQEWADVYLYSLLPEESTRIANLTPTRDIEQTLRELTGKYGDNMSIAVLPLGPLTIPYVEE